MKKLILAAAAVVMSASSAFATANWGNATLNESEQGSGTYYSEISQQTINYHYVNVSYTYEQVDETLDFGILSIYGPNTANFALSGLREIAIEGIEQHDIPVYHEGQMDNEELNGSQYTITFLSTTHMSASDLIWDNYNGQPFEGEWLMPTPYVWFADQARGGGAAYGEVNDDNVWTNKGHTESAGSFAKYLGMPGIHSTILFTEEDNGEHLGYVTPSGTVDATEDPNFKQHQCYIDNQADGNQLVCDQVTIYNDRDAKYWTESDIPNTPVDFNNPPDEEEQPAEYQQYLDALYNLCNSGGIGSTFACNLYNQLTN